MASHIAVTRPHIALRNPLLYIRRLATLRRERRALLALQDHMLADIGLTRVQALEEGNRPVWDAPPRWRQ